MDIKFDNEQEYNEFVRWANDKNTVNSTEMIEMRNKVKKGPGNKKKDAHIMVEKTIDVNRIWSTSLHEKYMEDVDLFKCSEPVVESFLKEEALKLEKNSACKTHLYFYEDKLFGFYTLFTDYVNLTRSKRDSEGWRNVSTLIGKQHYPAIRLHYIGVDNKFLKKGLGELLLLFALGDCVYISEFFLRLNGHREECVTITLPFNLSQLLQSEWQI